MIYYIHIHLYICSFVFVYKEEILDFLFICLFEMNRLRNNWTDLKDSFTVGKVHYSGVTSYMFLFKILGDAY